MEAIKRLTQHIDRLCYQGYYAAVNDSAVPGTFVLGQGSFPQGLVVKDARAIREKDRLLREVDELVTQSERRLARKYRGGQFVNEGASSARVIGTN